MRSFACTNQAEVDQLYYQQGKLVNKDASLSEQISIIRYTEVHIKMIKEAIQENKIILNVYVMTDLQNAQSKTRLNFKEKKDKSKMIERNFNTSLTIVYRHIYRNSIIYRTHM